MKIKEILDDLLITGNCPPDHTWRDRKEIQVEELGNERMIWRESISGTRLIVENMLREHGILENIENYMEIGSTQAIKSAVEAGLGISILPRLSLARELDQGFLREVGISGINITRDLWLVRKNRRFNKIGVSNFVNFLQ
ncbi:LysR substrate-binding domain-containing protein [Peribacillus simplex]|uniref:LysR substrate-binding domain-containing protein n=1 Tax=Peribacillus simplex TaxID=1478 RepID=UPI003D2BAEAF